MFRTLTTLCLVLYWLVPVAVAGEMAMNAALKEKAERMADDGLHFLRGTQAADGSWSQSVGITALALRAFLENRRGYNESDGPFITRPVRFLLDHASPDGSISETNHNRNYNTAVAITALQATKNPAYDAIIKKAQAFLKKLQIDEDEGYSPEHRYFGGIGYGGDERPDLSNQYHAIEALKETGLDPSDPIWERAVLFISRCQNWSETNDQEWAGNDGGFTYMPGYSPHGGTGSYGGMTHAGLLSLLYAGVDKSDPRVQTAYNWIRTNYTLDANPGAKDKQGLFYYYQAFAKTLYAYGDSTITDAKGVEHNWRNDLVTKLSALHNSDGSWVNQESGRWWENNKDLVTAWSVIALNFCIR